MLALALLAATTSFQFHVKVAEFPNVVYHVGCLSGRNPCTKAEVEKFWHRDLQWTDGDQRQLDTWNQVLDTVAARKAGHRGSPFLPNFASFEPALVFVNRVLAAGFDSRNAAEFRRRAAGLASPEEIGKLSDTLAHFQQRFHPWWKSKGEPYATAHRGTVQAAMKAPELSRLAEQIARFMEAEVTNPEYEIELLPRSDPKSDGAIATVIGNHVLGELTDQMKTADPAPFIMHEMTHALYELAPLTLQEQLIRDFAAAPEPQSQALYALMNESIATGVQIHLLPAAEADQDVYRDPFIPRIGRAVSEPLARALENGPTLFHGFMDTYLRAGAAEMKEELASPRFRLVTAMRLSIGELPEAEKAYQESFPAHWTASFSERERFPEMNTVILVPYDKLDALAGWDGIEAPSKAHRGFAFAELRKGKGYSFLLAGRDDATIAEVVKRLAAIRTGTADGVVVTVD